jgi:outer membrane protein assembly factor BamB
VPAANFLNVYRPAEIGYDSPPPSQRPARSGKIARRLIIALIAGFLAGAAIMLQVKGWGTLVSEAGGACGSSSKGISYGACPRGITPALITSFIIGFAAVPAAIALLFMKGWVRRGCVAVAAAGGLLAGQSLFGIWHGSDLTIAWAAPHDGSSQLTTVASWASGGSLIRVRVDEAVSYDPATGTKRWALTMPGVDVACGVSGTSSSGAIALIAYGQDSTTCDHVMAVDLASGRMIWSDPVGNPYRGSSPTGALAVTGNTAVVLTDNGIAGVNAASGKPRWTVAPPASCSFQQLAASGSSLVALAACNGSFVIVSIDAATGKAAWQHRVTEPSDSYQFQILSASPVVINDDLTGPRGTSTVRVLGPDGTVTSTFSVSGIPRGGGTVTLNTASTDGFGAPVVVADGMLVGVTEVNGPGDAIVGYRLADGTRQWLVNTPSEVHDVALRGHDLVFVDESDPAYSLEEIGVTTGTLHSFGFFTQRILQSDESGLYAFSGDMLVVNTNGASFAWPPVAAIKASAVAG